MNKSELNDVGLLTWSEMAAALDSLERKLANLTSQNATLRRRLNDIEEASVTKPKRKASRLIRFRG